MMAIELIGKKEKDEKKNRQQQQQQPTKYSRIPNAKTFFFF